MSGRDKAQSHLLSYEETIASLSECDQQVSALCEWLEGVEAELSTEPNLNVAQAQQALQRHNVSDTGPSKV